MSGTINLKQPKFTYCKLPKPESERIKFLPIKPGPEEFIFDRRKGVHLRKPWNGEVPPPTKSTNVSIETQILKESAVQLNNTNQSRNSPTKFLEKIQVINQNEKNETTNMDNNMMTMNIDNHKLSFTDGKFY